MGNIMIFIENAYLRNSLPGRAAIASVIYTPSLGRQIIREIKSLYRIDLLDKSANFDFSKVILNFDSNDWEKVLNNYPGLRYVVGTKYLPLLNSDIFRVIYKNSDFIMYEIIKNDI
jgi:hypothetical protein